MSYSVKEIYLTLQGEGFHTGKDAVFVDFLVAIFGQGLKKIEKKLYVIFATQILLERME